MTIESLQADRAIHDALLAALFDGAAADQVAERIASYAPPRAIELALARVHHALEERRGTVGIVAEGILLTAAALAAA
jgi:ABC-type uncharacterized transport system permease subunit